MAGGHRIIQALASVALAAAALVACQQPSPAQPAASPDAAAAATFTYKDFQVSPASVEVRAGQAVAWNNADSTTHTVTSGTPQAITPDFNKQLRGSATTTIAFARAGNFDFYCEFHNTMRGKVVVR